jgi:NADP-dependent 3-hydroxy acid dehydrogenase YdfG
VTGASSGIGRTLAFWYLNNGAKVALVGRDMVELENIGKLYPA